tara:strand:- start:2099 stop:2968 length:870 start_codon:yes stop_codon:yes gene_type:complete
MHYTPETVKEFADIDASIASIEARKIEIENIAKERRLQQFTASNGCDYCRGRGWVVTWDTMDILDGSAADYSDCPEKGCSAETRKASGLHPSNNRYDYNRRTRWNMSEDMTESERDEYHTSAARLVSLGYARQSIYDRAAVRKGKLVEVMRKSRTRNSAQVGVVGKVFWHGVSDYGTVKVGLMDTEGQKHWTTEASVTVISQTAPKSYEQKYEDQYPLLCKITRKTNKAICVFTLGKSNPLGGEWIPWSQILNADQVQEQISGTLLKDGKPATVMIPPWLAKKKGYLRE